MAALNPNFLPFTLLQSSQSMQKARTASFHPCVSDAASAEEEISGVAARVPQPNVPNSAQLAKSAVAAVLQPLRAGIMGLTMLAIASPCTVILVDTLINSSAAICVFERYESGKLVIDKCYNK
jgi:hypothetical protein